MEQDVLILGGGPAGISAALYALRAGCSVTVLARDLGSLDKAHLIENYYGLPQPLSGRELAENGRAQLLRLGGQLLETEATGLSWDGRFHLATAGDTLTAAALVLAGGSQRRSRPIPGLQELEGKGVSYCAVCDGFFYRGKSVAVLGSGAYAAAELEALLPLAGQAALLTNGEPLQTAVPEGVQLVEQPLAAVEAGADGLLRGVLLADGSRVECSGLFVALGQADGGALARQLGLALENNLIPVDAQMATALPGLFAAGDCVSRVKQVAVAVGQGALAGLSAAAYLRQQRQKG